MDPLTIAYFAFGVFTALLEMPDDGATIPDHFGGEIHFVRACLQYGERWLDNVVFQLAVDKGLVFVYEVAQPFGYKLAKHVLDNEGAFPNNETTQYWIEELLK